MRPGLLIAFALLAIWGAGCGGGAGGGADREDDVTAGANPRAFAISLDEMPDGARRANASVDDSPPCGPLPILGAGRGEVYQTPEFSIEGLSLRQAVGVFPRPLEAENAFASLVSQRRRTCILSSLRAFGRARVLATRKLALADDAMVMRFELKPSSGLASRHLDAISIHSGKAVTAVVFASLTRPVDRTIENRVLRAIVGKLPL